jgi:hypothetical protein
MNTGNKAHNPQPTTGWIEVTKAKGRAYFRLSYKANGKAHTFPLGQKTDHPTALLDCILRASGVADISTLYRLLAADKRARF